MNSLYEEANLDPQTVDGQGKIHPSLLLNVNDVVDIQNKNKLIRPTFSATFINFLNKFF